LHTYIFHKPGNLGQHRGVFPYSWQDGSAQDSVVYH